MSSSTKGNKLTSIWVDVKEALEIMKGFENGGIKQSNVQQRAKEGVRRLSRAHDALDKLVDFINREQFKSGGLHIAIPTYPAGAGFVKSGYGVNTP